MILYLLCDNGHELVSGPIADADHDLQVVVHAYGPESRALY